MKLNCPVCSAGLEFNDSMAKKLVRCPKCEQSFVVPAIPPQESAGDFAAPVTPPKDEFELSPSESEVKPTDAPVDPDGLKFCPGCGAPWKKGSRECGKCHFVPALGARLKPKEKTKLDLRVDFQKVYLVIFLAALAGGGYWLITNWPWIRRSISSLFN